MSNQDLLIFVPVGTSLFSNQGLKINEIASLYKADPNTVKRALDKVAKQFIDDSALVKAFERNPQEKGGDSNPAEMSSLYAFWLKKRTVLDECTVSIVLLHSPGIGKYCAESIEKLIQADSYFPVKPQWKVRLACLENLDPDSADKFPEAMNELAQAIRDEIKGFPGQIYLNITGGFKALPPYLVMISMALGTNAKTFYLYEQTRQIIELPSYPLTFDIFEWRDYRGLLLPFTMNIPGIGEEQKSALYKALGSSRLKALVRDEPPYDLTVVGRLMQGQYEEKRGLGLSAFGSGELLIEECKKYSSYLREYCIPTWRHLSIGDRIPETVDHGRGHIQRVLELAQQFLIAAKDSIQLDDDQLFVLISSIWLHDIGHTGDFFRFEGSGGLVQDKVEETSCEELSVFGDPELVRLYHNFLAYQLLKDHPDFFFPVESGRPSNKEIFRSIELLCLFHRAAMPVGKEEKGLIGQCKVTKGISFFDSERGSVVRNLPQLTAILRLCDSAENQEERTGGKRYCEIVKSIVDRRLTFLRKQTEYDDKNSCLRKEADFIEKQPGHFQKHQLISNVFFSKISNINGLDIKGIYGRNQMGKAPIIGLYLIANDQEAGYERDRAHEMICNGFLKEFLLVQDLVTDIRMVVLLVEDSQGHMETYQLVKTHLRLIS